MVLLRLISVFLSFICFCCEITFFFMTVDVVIEVKHYACAF